MLEIIDENSPYLAKARRTMELLDFEEARDDKNLNYWIKYTSKFGTLHLINPKHRLPFRELYDLDIKAGIFTIFFIIYQTIKFMIPKPKVVEPPSDAEIA